MMDADKQDERDAFDRGSWLMERTLPPYLSLLLIASHDDFRQHIVLLRVETWMFNHI